LTDLLVNSTIGVAIDEKSLIEKIVELITEEELE